MKFVWYKGGDHNEIFVWYNVYETESAVERAEGIERVRKSKKQKHVEVRHRYFFFFRLRSGRCEHII